MSREVRLTGRVTSGTGAAARFTALDWFQKALLQSFGFAPAPGTLNVVLDGDWHAVDRLLLAAGTVLVPPSTEHCCSILLPATLGRAHPHVEAVLLRPLVSGYDPARLEFLAPVRLRDVLAVGDGDGVAIALGPVDGPRWVRLG